MFSFSLLFLSNISFLFLLCLFAVQDDLELTAILSAGLTVMSRHALCSPRYFQADVHGLCWGPYGQKYIAHKANSTRRIKTHNRLLL